VRTETESGIAHLYRRAGFGLSQRELKAAAARGREACIEELLHPEQVEDPLDARLAELTGELLDLSKLEDLQQWWLYRMIHTRRPLQEKLTLFWHGHFATANSKVNDARLMLQQNRLLRERALGRFEDLLLCVARDPAMLVWLDNGASTRLKPNENFARELMELFTLGIGHYSEQEVREVARAFTGWKRRDAEFLFDAKEHDDGAKTILGETRAWTGEDVVAALARHPATAERLADRLVRFFVADEGRPALAARVARTFLESGGDLRASVGAILRSDEFWAEDARRARVKSPTELVIGAIRELSSTMPLRPLPQLMARMGQSLFNPPSVAGWDGGLAWIDTATLFERAGFANQLATQRGSKEDPWFDPAEWVQKGADAAAVLDAFADALLDGRVEPRTRAALEQYLAGRDKQGQPVPFKATPQALDEKVRGVVRLILSSPEYQLA
jgi:uncharacterized protein (DUF1800 family)